MVRIVVDDDGVYVLDRNENLDGTVLVQGIPLILDIVPDAIFLSSSSWYTVTFHSSRASVLVISSVFFIKNISLQFFSHSVIR